MPTPGTVALALASTLSTTCWAQVTQRVDVGSGGEPAVGSSYGGDAAISADGRYVVFSSSAANLVPNDSNGIQDVFLRDRGAGTTELVSVAWTSGAADNYSYAVAVTPGGRFVLFMSNASNLVPGDTNAREDIFVRDRPSGTTERVSVASTGEQANGNSVDRGSITDDGRFVSFASVASNLVPGDTNDESDVFVHDRRTGTTERVSVDSNGTQSFPFVDNDQWSCRITPDGRYVAFVSELQGLVDGDTNLSADAFVRDRWTGVTERVSVSSSGAQGFDPCLCDNPGLTCGISADGRYVAFTSEADNLVPGDTNGPMWGHDVFVHDRQTGATERVSVASTGEEANSPSWFSDMSSDGRWVTFVSEASNLVAGDTNAQTDVFVHDRMMRTTERASLAWDGAQASAGGAIAGSISSDGRLVSFLSLASNLVPGDVNGWDVFVRDRLGGTDFMSTCEPGVGGVIACPCANMPSGTGSGCGNSSSTDGATLAASGGTFLSSDSLLLVAEGMRPGVLTITLPGNVFVPSGVVFGQGVRCVGGSIHRLFVQRAVGGEVSVPDFQAGEPSISARSAALGDLIRPGESRWYFVAYRDKVVLGGCPASSKFNATQTGEVLWIP